MNTQENPSSIQSIQKFFLLVFVLPVYFLYEPCEPFPTCQARTRIAEWCAACSYVVRNPPVNAITQGVETAPWQRGYYVYHGRGVYSKSLCRPSVRRFCG